MYYIPTSLEEVIITDTSKIDDFAFNGAQRILNIEISATVESIGLFAFNNVPANIFTSLKSKPENWNLTTNIGADTIIWGYEKTKVYNGISYALSSNGTAYVLGAESLISKDIVIQDQVDGYEVIEIAGNAFRDRVNIESVYIPNSISKIGLLSFAGSNLKRITIPNSIVSISAAAFQNAVNLEEIIFENDSKLTSIGDYAFYGVALKSITIPNSVVSIGGAAFLYASSLEEVLFEKDSNLVTIGSNAFSGTSRLENIVIPITVVEVGDGAFDGITNIFAEAKTKPNGWYEDGNYSYHNVIWGFIEYTNDGVLEYAISEEGTYVIRQVVESKETNIVIPNQINGYNVIGIHRNAFSNNKNIENIIIPNSVTSIGSYAIRNSGLKTITFEEGSQLTSIAYGAFYEASSLTSIVIPSSVTSIGDHAFYGTSSLTSITLPFVGASRTATGSNAYFGYIFGASSYYFNGYYLPSTLTEVIITDATSIGDYAFYGASSLVSVTFEEGSQLNSIGDSAFNGASSLTSIVIPNSVTSIGSFAFQYSGLQNITFEEGAQLISIGSHAFLGASSLISILIPNSVTSIGTSAFSGASSLTSIVIPNSVTSIGSGAFLNTGLTIIYTSISSKPTNWNSNWVSNDVTVVWGYEQTVENDGILYALSTKSVAYVIGTNESMTSNVVVLDYINGYEVIEIANSAFKDNLVIETIYIPNTIVKIGYQAFYGATNFNLVEFETYSQLEHIEAYAFGNLANLEAIIIPISVYIIKNNAFANTTDLIIYVFHTTKPLGWEVNWNPNNLNVVWSYNE